MGFLIDMLTLAALFGAAVVIFLPVVAWLAAVWFAAYAGLWITDRIRDQRRKQWQD